MRILKIVGIAVGVLVLAVGAVVAYVAATFDPNQYKPRIVQAVKEKTQRTLRLEGDIELSLWPNLGARIGRASLSERASEREFAAVEEARVSLKLLPLLSRQAVVDTVRVKGLRANLVRAKDGRTNVDDLAGPVPGKPVPEEAGARFTVDIAGVDIQDAAISYTDQMEGVKYAFSQLNIRTGRIAPGVPIPVELSVHARADKPKLDLRAALKARLTFDPPAQRYALEGLDLDARGEAAGITGLAATAKGDLDVRGATNEMSASKLVVSASGKQAGGDMMVKLDAPRLELTKQRVSGERLTFEAVLSEARSRLNARFEMPGIEGTAKALKAGQMTATVDLKHEGGVLKAKLASPVTGSVEAQRIELPKFTASLSVADPRLPKSALEATITGAATVDGAKQNATATLTARIDESTITGRAGLARFSPPFYTFSLDIDRLDADRYLLAAGTKPGRPAPKAAGAPKPGQPEQPFDLTALRGLNASGSLRIGELKAANARAANVRLEIKAANGRLDVSPMSANLYQGTAAGALAVNAAPATPVFALRQNLAGVAIGPLLKDLADNDSLEGRGNVGVDVTAQGKTVAALKKALNGSAAVKLADGAVKGIDIAGSIRSAKARLGTLRGEQTQQADKSQKTDFSELTATFTIRNGVARNSDLSLKSPLLRVGGEGEVNLGEDSLNYLVKASIVGTTRGQGGRDLADLTGVTVPVRVSGPLAAPSYRLDFGSMVTDTARRQVEQRVRGQLEERLLGGAAKPGAKEAPKEETRSDPLRDTLRGILRR